MSLNLVVLDRGDDGLGRDVENDQRTFLVEYVDIVGGGDEVRVPISIDRDLLGDSLGSRLDVEQVGQVVVVVFGKEPHSLVGGGEPLPDLSAVQGRNEQCLSGFGVHFDYGAVGDP